MSIAYNLTVMHQTGGTHHNEEPGNEQILVGECLAGFFISGAPAYPVVENSGGLFEVTFLDDGTVVLPRGIGITPRRHTPTPPSCSWTSCSPGEG